MEPRKKPSKQDSAKADKSADKRHESPPVFTSARGGRPTDYTLDRGEELISWMEQGYSITASAAKMGFHRDTVYEWRDRHPEFSDALKRATGLRVFKLETDLLAAPDGPTVTSRIFALKNACPDEWRDKQTVEHDAAKDSPLAQLAAQLAGTALRPKEPAAEPVTSNEEGA